MLLAAEDYRGVVDITALEALLEVVDHLLLDLGGVHTPTGTDDR